MRTTVLEVDKKKFKKNIEKIKKYVSNKEILPVIKANGYGTYINKELDLINEFNIVGVAIVDEAIELRKIGYKKDILVLNQPSIEEINDIEKYNLVVGLSSNEFLDFIIRNKNNIRVHLEIETGMNRTGIKMKDLDSFINKIKSVDNISVEGVYTHLSCADYDKEYTNMQLNIFDKAVNIVKDNFKNIKYIHSQASNGLLNYNDKVTNLVRAGIIMYGYSSFEGADKLIDIEPICKLRTTITYLKEIDSDESVSYGRKFISSKKMKVATIPIGYADGLRRELFGFGEVVINGKKANIIGTICMDSCMIDVTNIKNVKVGDIVYIWDNDLITLDEIAKKCNTINYEIMSTISDRVPRVFID